MFFHSYKEAHEALGIPGSYQQGTIGNDEIGIESIKITSNPTSLDRITPDMKTIYYVGIGKKSSQGEPAKHQTLEDQTPFLVSKKRKNAFPVLIKLKSGVVYYAGLYEVSRIFRRISPKAKHYYHIELKNVENPRQPFQDLPHEHV